MCLFQKEYGEGSDVVLLLGEETEDGFEFYFYLFILSSHYPNGKSIRESKSK